MIHVLFHVIFCGVFVVHISFSVSLLFIVFRENIGKGTLSTCSQRNCSSRCRDCANVITESWDQIILDYYMFGYMNNMIGLFGAQRETELGKGLGAEGGTNGIAGKWDR